MRRLFIAAMLVLSVAVTASAQYGNRFRREQQERGLSGVVQSTNQRLNYFTVRDEVSNRDVKIDVRQMDTEASVNVWHLRAGDRVSVEGTWSDRDTFRAERVTMQSGAGGVGNQVVGVVQSVNRRLNYFTVRGASERDVKIDVRRLEPDSSIDPNDLRYGDRVLVEGRWRDRDTFEAERVRMPGRSRRGDDARGNVLNATVQSTNRRLNYITVRDQATGRTFKIDVRQMDTSRSFNVWKLRAGDRVVARGEWSNDDTFRAETVEYRP